MSDIETEDLSEYTIDRILVELKSVNKAKLLDIPEEFTLRYPESSRILTVIVAIKDGDDLIVKYIGDTNKLLLDYVYSSIVSRLSEM